LSDFRLLPQCQQSISFPGPKIWNSIQKTLSAISRLWLWNAASICLCPNDFLYSRVQNNALLVMENLKYQKVYWLDLMPDKQRRYLDIAKTFIQSSRLRNVHCNPPICQWRLSLLVNLAMIHVPITQLLYFSWGFVVVVWYECMLISEHCRWVPSLLKAR
jgi:hypothetical protein